LPLIGGGLICHSSTGGHLCRRCPSSFIVAVWHGHHCPWVGHHCLGGRSFRIMFRSVIVCGCQVIVCVWCPSFLGVSWVVVVIGGFPHAVCHSWVPGSLCKWVLGLVCGRRRPSVGCQLESHVDVACLGATSAVWWWRRGLGTSAVLDRCLVTTSPATWHLDAMLKRSVVGAGELAHLGSLPSVSVHVCMLSCPRHRVIVVVIPLVGHVVVPSPSCVSARWVGTNVGWGYLPWHPKYTMTTNDK